MSANVEAPQNPEEFAHWSKLETCGEFTSATKQWYTNIVSTLWNFVFESPYLSNLETLLNSWSTEYSKLYSGSLFANGRSRTPDWKKKTFDSFVDKLYRMNCVENEAFPDPPNGRWLTLADSPDFVDDIVRCTLIVAYADGPGFVASKIRESAEAAGLTVDIKDHAKDKGYYAHHIYIGLSIPVPSQNGTGFLEKSVKVEIQITTELQGVLREITHNLYRIERLEGGPTAQWKSDFSSGRFRAAYMAHSLRFIEAMIVELRGNVTKA